MISYSGLNVICMSNQKKRKIGIIICDRYHSCAGGKCFRALRNREGSFSIYKDQEVELVGYTTCGGCPGGNVEYCVEEMKKNGAEVVHFATGMVVGYPPCPHIDHFRVRYAKIRRRRHHWHSSDSAKLLQHPYGSKNLGLKRMERKNQVCTNR
jgi:predicted metal-binding protein